MPWCPICKNEYKAGYETCADCGAPLVAELEDIDKVEEDIHNHDHILSPADYVLNEALEDMDIINAMSDIMSDKEGVFIEGDNIPEVEEILKAQMAQMSKHDNQFKPFVKAKDRAEEYKSSAFALLLVGVLGILFMILSIFNVIPFSITISFKNIGFIAMLIIFVAFIIIGIKSIVEAKMISELGDVEDELVSNIEALFQNTNKDDIDRIALSAEDYSLNDELKFFKREAVIRKMILDKFGEIDSALLDHQVESIFNNIFED